MRCVDSVLTVRSFRSKSYGSQVNNSGGCIPCKTNAFKAARALWLNIAVSLNSASISRRKKLRTAHTLLDCQLLFPDCLWHANFYRLCFAPALRISRRGRLWPHCETVWNSVKLLGFRMLLQGVKRMDNKKLTVYEDTMPRYKIELDCTSTRSYVRKTFRTCFWEFNFLPIRFFF